MKADRRVFCIGETVLDIIFKDNQPVAAKPGGSMLNSAVSLGRAGIPVNFISDYGSDQAGQLIHQFLVQNSVSTDHVSRYTNGKTALSLAFLDDQQNAAYSFYKMYPEVRLTITLPDAKSGDIILFGSFYALTGLLREKIMEFIRQAKSSGAYIIYDPNFRSAHLDELENLRPWILENISMASLVRGSDEDFRYIFGASDGQQTYYQIYEAGCHFLVYTKNRQGVEVIAPGYFRSYPVPPIRVVSTIGAGDAFNAGIIYAMMTSEDTRGGIPGSFWNNIISHGLLFSEDVCMHMENYISVELGGRLKMQ